MCALNFQFHSNLFDTQGEKSCSQNMLFSGTVEKWKDFLVLSQNVIPRYRIAMYVILCQVLTIQGWFTYNAAGKTMIPLGLDELGTCHLV